jgi:hypothetical protein
METTITSIIYQGMLQQFLIPQLDEDDQEERIHFQQDCSSGADTWPPGSLDLTPLDFFLWGLVDDRVFVQHFPANVAEHRTRITAAVAEVTPEILRSV